uniref:Uncharacterized protein n=1 Tax=Meloidogyne javanica TaxID=6303 RepID=A0A915LR86_MELJA
NSTANESEKSSINNSDAENCVDDPTETRSISTAHTSGTRHTSVAEQNTYGNLCSELLHPQGQNNSLAISLEPCMPKPLQLLSKFDGDYADIDELI